jgi:hypothetical protein
MLAERGRSWLAESGIQYYLCPAINMQTSPIGKGSLTAVGRRPPGLQGQSGTSPISSPRGPPMSGCLLGEPTPGSVYQQVPSDRRRIRSRQSYYAPRLCLHVPGIQARVLLCVKLPVRLKEGGEKVQGYPRVLVSAGDGCRVSTAVKMYTHIVFAHVPCFKSRLH